MREIYLKAVRAADCESFKTGAESIVIARIDHEELGYIDVIPPVHARFKNNAPLKLGKPAPKVGQDTALILKEHGYSEHEIADLLESELVSEALHQDYLPD
jgi:crotonobetainyl-CoA:carnitine CoA-transferase CaiB-like acyl-CoA transferase